MILFESSCLYLIWLGIFSLVCYNRLLFSAAVNSVPLTVHFFLSVVGSGRMVHGNLLMLQVG